MDNSGETFEADGYVLKSNGLQVRLGGALTSELLIAKAI